jgi:hypothetical protein
MTSPSDKLDQRARSRTAESMTSPSDKPTGARVNGESMTSPSDKLDQARAELWRRGEKIENISQIMIIFLTGRFARNSIFQWTLATSWTFFPVHEVSK